MKKSALLMLLLVPFFAIQAQKIKVSETSTKMSAGSNNGLVVFIPEADAKTVEKEWKKLMKDHGAKASTSKGEVMGDDAEISSISENTVDVYARAEKADNGTTLYVFYDLGGAFLSSSQHGDAYKAAEKMVHAFAVEQAKEAVTEQLKEATKTLEGLQKDQEKLEKENKDLHKSIEDYKEKIKEAEKGIEDNKKAQEKKKEDIQKQIAAVKGVEEKLKKID